MNKEIEKFEEETKLLLSLFKNYIDQHLVKDYLSEEINSIFCESLQKLENEVQENSRKSSYYNHSPKYFFRFLPPRTDLVLRSTSYEYPLPLNEWIKFQLRIHKNDNDQVIIKNIADKAFEEVCSELGFGKPLCFSNRK